MDRSADHWHQLLSEEPSVVITIDDSLPTPIASSSSSRLSDLPVTPQSVQPDPTAYTPLPSMRDLRVPRFQYSPRRPTSKAPIIPIDADNDEGPL